MEINLSQKNKQYLIDQYSSNRSRSEIELEISELLDVSQLFGILESNT